MAAAVMIRGAGDVASAVAVALARDGFRVALNEDALPSTTRRGMAFADAVEEDDIVAAIAGAALRAPFDGILRGLTHDGVDVAAGTKVIEVDPRNDPAAAFGLGARPKRIAAGVLAALKSTASVKPQ